MKSSRTCMIPIWFLAVNLTALSLFAVGLAAFVVYPLLLLVCPLLYQWCSYPQST